MRRSGLMVVRCGPDYTPRAQKSHAALAAFALRPERSDLGEYIKTVESHLNVVIQMFERHLRDDHGQRPS